MKTVSAYTAAEHGHSVHVSAKHTDDCFCKPCGRWFTPKSLFRAEPLNLNKENGLPSGAADGGPSNPARA